MAERTLQAKLKVRSDTATNWQSNNPVLLQGEPALETDTNKLKFGNGTSAYNDLPYISSGAVTVEANPAEEATEQLNTIEINGVVYEVSSNMLVDLGDVGVLSGVPTTITITSEQCTRLLAADTSIVRFTTGGVIINLLRILKLADGGGSAVYTASMFQDGHIGSYVLQVQNSSPTQAQIEWTEAELSGTTVVANPTASATSALSKLQVNDAVYSVGAPVIDLGEVTLTQMSIGGVSLATANDITVSAEQATQAQADAPPVVKVSFGGESHEFYRTNISSDASASYISFAATEDFGEGTKFYNLQITAPLTSGSASAMIIVWTYAILQGLNNAYEAGEFTFEDGVATKTLSEEEAAEFGEGTYNQIRFWNNVNSNETYQLYLSHVNRGASLIDSHNYSYFGIVENASVTGEAGGITAFAAYFEGTTLTIEQVAIGSGSSVPFVDLGTVALTQSGADETIKTGTISITSEQLSQMTGSVPAVVKFTISGSGSLQISLSERVGNASSPSVVAYVGAFQNGTNTIKSYLVNVNGSSATIQEVTLYTVTPNAGTGGTPLTSLKIGATTYSIPQGSQINNGIPEGGLAGQALTKQSGTDYDVAWTTINTSDPTVMTEAAYAEALAAGTIENDKLYYIQGTSDDTLTTAAESTTYDNATSGLAATNVQAAIDELKENEFSGSYNDLTDKPTIPTALAQLSEKSYNSLTDKPTIPTLDVASIATALGLTTTQLNNLIAFAKSITSASTSGTTVNNEFTAQSFDTTA